MTHGVIRIVVEAGERGAEQGVQAGATILRRDEIQHGRGPGNAAGSDDDGAE